MEEAKDPGASYDEDTDVVLTVDDDDENRARPWLAFIRGSDMNIKMVIRAAVAEFLGLLLLVLLAVLAVNRILRLCPGQTHAPNSNTR